MRLVRRGSDCDCAPMHLSWVLDVTLRGTRQRPKLRPIRTSVLADHDLERGEGPGGGIRSPLHRPGHARPEGRTGQVAAVSPSRADSRVRAGRALRDDHDHERQHDDDAAPPPRQTDGA